MFDQIMPFNEVITDDLMNVFGGNELNTMHEKMEEEKKKNISPELSIRMENSSCMSTQSPEWNVKFNPKEDKLMNDIIKKYK